MTNEEQEQARHGRRLRDQPLVTRLRYRYRRVSDFLGHNPVVPFVLVVLLAAFALYKVEGVADDAKATADATAAAVVTIEAERSQRIEVVGQIIKFTCEDNNSQDDTLAALVAVSLSGSGFTEGIDRSRLTPFDLQVLTTLAKIQRLSQGANSHLNRVFERKLRALRDLRECPTIVESYLNGVPPPASALGLGNGHR